MQCNCFAVVTPLDQALFFVLLLLVFVLTVVAFGFSWYLGRRRQPLSPYSGKPLRLARDIAFSNAEKVMRYLYDLKQYDNRIFLLKRSALCRETGRIFPNAVIWFDIIQLDWSFLNKRYPGLYVSWGSLSAEQQQEIREAHHTLEGYQTGYSSPNPSPRGITPEYAYCSPGPLYVDMTTKVLVGWKCVPNTDLEVLIVQKPVDFNAQLSHLARSTIAMKKQHDQHKGP